MSNYSTDVRIGNWYEKTFSSSGNSAKQFLVKNDEDKTTTSQQLGEWAREEIDQTIYQQKVTDLLAPSKTDPKEHFATSTGAAFTDPKDQKPVFQAPVKDPKFVAAYRAEWTANEPIQFAHREKKDY